MVHSSPSSYSTSKGHSFKKTVDDHMRSTLMFGNKQSLFVSQSIDYRNSIACIPYPYNDSGSGGVWAAHGSCTSTVQACPETTGGCVPGRVPLTLELADGEPIYVNPKQYRGILRRRQLRAKLEAQNKLARGRKPYLHESRHLHAMKRARGSGGRFLNTKQHQQQSARPNKDSSNSSGSTRLRLGGSSSAPKTMTPQESIKKACSSAPDLLQFPGQHLSFSDYLGQASAQTGVVVLHNGTQHKAGDPGF